MSILGRRCPRCGTLMPGSMRFCGRCGLDLWSQETKDNNDIESIRSVRPDTAVPEGEQTRPTMTARVFAPKEERKGLFVPKEEREELYAPEERDGLFGMSRRDLLKLGGAAAAALAIIIAAIVLIARMNRKTPAPEVSEPVEEVHVIAADESVLETPAPTPAPTPSPAPSPTPTAPLSTTAPSPTPGFRVSEAEGVVYAQAASLDIRSGPGAEFEVIATAPYGTELQRTGILDGWMRVEVNGQTGYVPTNQISMQMPEPTPTPTPLTLYIDVEEVDDTVVVDSGANLRLGPGTEYGVVTTAGAGRELHRTGIVGGWSQVEFDGYKVYVFTELLRSNSEAPAATDAPAAAEATPVPADTGAAAAGTVTMRMNGNIRTGPGTEYDSLGLAMGGDVLEVTGQENGWYRVTFRGQTGYVLGSLTE